MKSIDTAAASKVPGVVHVHVLREAGSEIQTEGDLIAVVAAETEAAARDGVAQLAVEYELLDVFVRDEDLDAAEAAGRTKRAGGKVELVNEPGDDEDEEEFEEKEINRLLAESKYVVEGFYGIDAITHCCLEPHGSTLQWNGSKLDVYLSTQNVSMTDDGFAGALEITADDVDVHCEYIGGGFGSKFQPNYWGIAAAEIAKATGRPVKFMLQRDQELKIGGNRPSGYIKVRLGADERRCGSGLGFGALGDHRSQRRCRQRQQRAVCLPAAEQPARRDRRGHQQRTVRRLAGSQSSAGLCDDANRLRRPGCQDGCQQPGHLPAESGQHFVEGQGASCMRTNCNWPPS